MDVFLSVGRTSNETQKAFVDALVDRLRDEGMSVRRAEFSAVQPLIKITEEMRRCSGAVVVAYERLYVLDGMELRGAEDQRAIASAKITTVWNQIEASIAYTLGLPLLVICESGARNEGLLENRYDWFVNYMEIDKTQLYRREFNEVLKDWRERVVARASAGGDAGWPKPNAELSIAEIVGRLKLDQLATVLSALVALVAGAFAVAYWIGSKFGP